jgi:hypothetical protein
VLEKGKIVGGIEEIYTPFDPQAFGDSFLGPE